MVLNPTDNTPNAKGVAFIESDAVTAFVTNVPEPGELPGGEVYKLWGRESGNGEQVVTTMRRSIPRLLGRTCGSRFPPNNRCLHPDYF